MADRETTQRTYVGHDVPGLSLVDVSGQKSNPYTTSVVKRGYGKDDAAADPKDKGNRNAVLKPADTGGAAHKIAAVTSFPREPQSGRMTRQVRGPYRQTANPAKGQ